MQRLPWNLANRIYTSRGGVRGEGSLNFFSFFDISSVDPSFVEVLLVIIPVLSVLFSLLSILVHSHTSHAQRLFQLLLHRHRQGERRKEKKHVDQEEEEEKKRKEANKQLSKEEEEEDGKKGDLGELSRDDGDREKKKKLEKRKEDEEEEGREEKDAEGFVRIALLTAHPDDEVMFFSPLLSLLRQFSKTFQVYVLCLSTGNAYGLGRLREQELYRATELYGIPRENVEIVNDEENLSDGLTLWSADLVAEHIDKFLTKHSISSVFSFDEAGVSRHPNHISVYRGIRRVLEQRQRRAASWEEDEEGDLLQLAGKTSKKECRQPRGVFNERQAFAGTRDEGVKKEQEMKKEEKASSTSFDVYVLRSHSLLRKYSGLLDIIFSTIECRNRPERAVAVSLTPLTSIRGMLAHRSQFVWFRWLFVFFSSYTYSNAFEKLVIASEDSCDKPGRPSQKIKTKEL
ncbi:n-acetylglucosaminylphosphatidylinositol deacetylase [Cystoisospora suis]|uniref:N-acetylglucosaminylphosphatidylinositol deacetylase n=1 Tax=Cystoisospora suis TaxID=483139 RepID=A0A2C6KV68_9APIC|nr:n-acetylglucosaminylphosphatidylinositol deacetylase [Cystoisospora suis]